MKTAKLDANPFEEYERNPPSRPARAAPLDTIMLALRLLDELDEFAKHVRATDDRLVALGVLQARPAPTRTKPGDIPSHLKVPHACIGKRFGCTKVIYGNAYKIHKNACKFIKAGKAVEAKPRKETA